MVCSLSRYVMVAWVAGLVAATATGSDAVGWAAAAVTVLAVWALGRLQPGRFGSASCAVPGPSTAADTTGRSGAGSTADDDPIPVRADAHAGIHPGR